jgi:hypothetical protein
VLLREIGRQLARLGMAPDILLHLYEGQPWEKMLTRGFREHVPGTRIVGVQPAPFARNYISFFPSQRAIAEGAIPDLFLVNGERYADWLSEAGVPAERVGVVGALRYEDAVDFTRPPGIRILCCTGIDLDEAIELASKATLAAKGLGRPLLINYHPVTDEEFRLAMRAAVMRAAGPNADHVTFSTAPMRELLDTAGTVLYTTSAACFEAVQAGRTAIYVGRDLQLDYDKLPDALALRCRSVTELRALLEKSDLAETSAQSPRALGQWLGAVIDAERLATLLMPSANARCSKQAAMRGAM